MTILTARPLRRRRLPRHVPVAVGQDIEATSTETLARFKGGSGGGTFLDLDHVDALLKTSLDG